MSMIAKYLEKYTPEVHITNDAQTIRGVFSLSSLWIILWTTFISGKPADISRIPAIKMLFCWLTGKIRFSVMAPNTKLC